VVGRVFPFIFPNGQRLDEDAGLKQHVIGDIGQFQLGGEEIAGCAAQDHGNVGIAVFAGLPAGAGAEQHGAREVVRIAPCHLFHETREREELLGFHILMCTVCKGLEDLEQQIRDLIAANGAAR
jgi:hypothetical protein